ncbi:MAG: hypothetical protein KAR00_00370 [Candidatus Pacebacteria bacterium]|nr:hypothetical protein [Candidatus Paceibacterota bacterium]
MAENILGCHESSEAFAAYSLVKIEEVNIMRFAVARFENVQSFDEVRKRLMQMGLRPATKKGVSEV